MASLGVALASKTSAIVAVGIIVREVFSFWTGHPFDFELWVRTAYWVAHGVSPFGVLPSAPGLSFASVYSPQTTSTIGYLPFWPLLTAGLYELYNALGVNSRFFLYFLLKQPIIAGDVALGYSLYQYVRSRSPEKSNWVLKFWLLSPLNIILSGIWGMFDSLSMLFVVLALGWRSATFRAVGSGVATFIKSIPVIYSVPLALSGTRKLRSVIIAIGLPTLISLAVILVAGWSLQNAYGALSSTVTKGGESLSAADILFYLNVIGLVSKAQLRIMGPVSYAWVIAVIVATVIAYRRFGFRDDRSLVQSMLLCTLTFLLFRLQVNEQYAIYLFALSSIDVMLWNGRRMKNLFVMLGIVLGYLVVNNPLLIRFASPVFPNVLVTEAILIIVYNLPRFGLKVGLSIAFTLSTIWYMVRVLRDRQS